MVRRNAGRYAVATADEFVSVVIVVSRCVQGDFESVFLDAIRPVLVLID